MNLHEFFYIPIKLLKSGLVANVKEREKPDFGMLHHIFSLDFEYFYPYKTITTEKFQTEGLCLHYFFFV